MKETGERKEYIEEEGGKKTCVGERNKVQDK